MRKPLVGIIGNHYLINDQYPAQAAGEMNIDAVAQVSDALPVVIPCTPSATDIPALLETCDGFLFTGGRPNVHPEEYGHEETEAHGMFDRARRCARASAYSSSGRKGAASLGNLPGISRV